MNSQNLKPISLIYRMDGVQPFKESGSGSVIDLDSEVKYEPESSLKNECEMDDYDIKEESIEDSNEKLIPIEIKDELNSERETTSENLKVIKEMQQKVHELIHRAARFSIGHCCFKQSITSIMCSPDWKMPEKHFYEELIYYSLCFCDPS